MINRKETGPGRDGRIHVLLLDTNDAMGGVVRVHLNLLNELDRSRFRVTAACLRRGDLVEAFRQVPGIRLLPLETGTKPVTLGEGFRSRLADAAGFVPMGISVLRLAGYCLRNRVQVIHTSDKKRALAITLAVHRLTRIPYVYHIHDVFVDYRLNHLALARAGTLVANSQDMKNDFLEHAGAGMERIQVVYNGLDPDAYRADAPSTLRKELGLSEDRILVGIASRLAPPKGQETFLRAAALLAAQNEKAEFIVAGDDAIFSDNQEYVPFLHDLVRDLGIGNRVHFLGYRTDMVNVYRALDVAVNAARREAFGMVVVEPMACGKPVVGTRAGGIPEIIRHGENGYLFPPGDHEAMAGLLGPLLEDDDLRETMGRRARETVLDRFTIARQTRSMETVYEQLAAGDA